MNSDDCALVQRSFARVFARKAHLADRFYHHLFRGNPKARALFGGNMSRQKEMFTTMLTSSVRSMSDSDSFDALADRLADSHARFHLTQEDLSVAVQALIGALRDVLGNELSEQEAQAWQQAITRLTRMMAVVE